MTEAKTTATVEQEGVRLQATFADITADGGARVSYRVQNRGETAIAVLDRGDRHAVLTKRQRLGRVGVPAVVEEGGDVTLRHVARELPHPTPTVPPVPLAAKLDPGASLEGEFVYSPLLPQPPKRLRWCVGVAAFDPDRFTAPERGDDGPEVWRASFDVAQAQRLLCTPWFDLAAGAFADEP